LRDLPASWGGWESLWRSTSGEYNANYGERHPSLLDLLDLIAYLASVESRQK